MELLERLGIRWLHLVISDRTVQKPLPSLKQAPLATGYSATEIDHLRQDARYFGQANLLRLITHLPIIALFARFGATTLAIIFALFGLFHAILLILESYKLTVVHKLRPSGADAAPPESAKAVRSETWGDWWFVPKKWENEKFYRKIGLVIFRNVVEYIIHGLSLTRAERRSGKNIDFVRGTAAGNVVSFENQSRVNECVHLVLAGIDAIPVVFALSLQLWLALPYTIWLLWGDVYCVLLQRLNRCRIWPLIRRARKVEARST